MKTLIIIAGLPGTGKSYLSRIVKKRLKNCLYFDSDLFAKNYFKNGEFSDSKARLGCHLAKFKSIKKEFRKYNNVILDTCFDLPVSRTMIYKFVKENNIKLNIIEVKCSLKTAKIRILGKIHEKRMPGTAKSRWKAYLQMRKTWKKIRKVDLVVDSDKDVRKQLDLFLKNKKN